jgi:hypothetical protein
MSLTTEQGSSASAPRAYAIATVYHEATILPHFLAHYERLGFARTLLCVNVNGNPDLLGVVRSHVDGRKAEIVDIYDTDYSPVTRTDHELNACRKLLKDEDWCGFYDIDDFCEFPLPLPSLLEELGRDRRHFVRAKYVDRIGLDGTLPPIGAGNIWLQYPLGCQPGFVQARQNLGVALGQLGDADGAAPDQLPRQPEKTRISTIIQISKLVEDSHSIFLDAVP